MRKRIAAAVICMLLLASVTLPVTVRAAEETPAENPEKQTISLLYKYDSFDTAVVRSVDQEAGTVTLCQHDLGRYYTLTVDHTSMIYDAHGRPISSGLLKPGQVVDVTFLHQSRHLNSLVVSGTAWVREDVRNYGLDMEHEIFTIDGQNYHLANTALLMNTEGALGERIIAEELLPDDVLMVTGIDREIYSVVVTGGHGYLRLTSTEVAGRDITGAWLNLDNRIIRRVESKMLVAAPEGEYTLQIVGQGANDSRTVTISRGMETVIDASSIQMEAPDMTEVTFTIEPENAEVNLTIDEENVKPNLPTYLSVGVHKLKVTADGYVTISEFLRVGEKKATVHLELEKDEEGASTGASSGSSDGNTGDTSSANATSGYSDWWNSSVGYSNTGATNGDAGSTAATNATTAVSDKTITVVDVSGNESQQTTLTGYEIRVESPEGVEFYFDGNYMGITPTSFVKVSGQHTVTMSREGYETKSYNIYIDDARTNKTYAFPALVRIEEEE